MEYSECGKVYKNLAEMQESPEYQEYVELIRRGVEAGKLVVYPPLPPRSILSMTTTKTKTPIHIYTNKHDEDKYTA